MGKNVRFKPYKAFGGRLQIPEALARYPHLTWSAKGIYAALLRFASRESTCVWPTLNTIGELTGLRFSSVSEQLSNLASAGLIERVVEGRKTLTFFIWNEAILGPKPDDLEAVEPSADRRSTFGTPKDEEASNLRQTEGSEGLEPSADRNQLSADRRQPSADRNNMNKEETLSMNSIHEFSLSSTSAENLLQDGSGENSDEERECLDDKDPVELLILLEPLAGGNWARNRYGNLLKKFRKEDILEILIEAVSGKQNIDWVNDTLEARYRQQNSQRRAGTAKSGQARVGKWGYGT